MDLKPPEIVIPHGNDGLDDNNNIGFNNKEPTVVETIPVIPLGKAVHTLLHVKEEVFQQAIVKSSNRDSPIVRALYSIDDYLNSSRFADVYDPLKDQFLKPKSSQAKPALRLARYLLMDSQHKNNFRAFFKTHELQSDDKRRHLAGVILLESVVDMESIMEFIPDLVHLVQLYGDKPTLTACISCDIVIAYSKNTLLPKESTKNNTGSMIQVIGDQDEDWDGIDDTWGYVKDVFSFMEKWYPFDPIAISAWKELERFIEAAQNAILNGDLYQRINKAWNILTNVLTSKNIVSKKTLSIKKQLSCLEQESDDPLVQYISIITVALLQKSQWINNAEGLLSPEERDIKQRISDGLTKMMKQKMPSPFKSCGTMTLCQVILHAPHLIVHNPEIEVPASLAREMIKMALTDNISLDQLPRSIIFSNETIQILLHDIVGASNGKAADILNDIIGKLEQDADTSMDTTQFSAPLVDELLKYVTKNDLACKVLIRMMDIADLRSLIPRLMKMGHDPDPRTNQVCKALIAKALMAKPWSNHGDGLLVLIDMIRYFKNIKKYPNIVSQNDKTFTSPADLITSNVTSSVQETLSNDVIESYTAELLSILQLWAMKATKEAIQNGLSQLVYASYSAPNDGVFIDAWKNISHGLINSNNPDAIWVVIKHCYRIMKNQVKLTNELLDEKTEKSDREVYTIIVKRLSPLLILRTFPQQAYHYVYLSKPSILKYNVDWDALDINPRSIRWLDEDDHNDPEHLDQSELLFEELSSRAQDPTEFQENQTLAKTLLTHIYCQLS